MRWKIIILLICVFMAICGDAAAGYASSVEARSTANAAKEQMERDQQCMARSATEMAEAKKAIAESAAQFKSIEEEESRVLAELAGGYFCSRCKRSKSEIEKGGETFEQHLQNVNGDPVPAPPELIAERKTEFVNKLDGIKRKWDADKKKYGVASARAQTCFADRERQRSKYWEAYLWAERLQREEKAGIKKHGPTDAPAWRGDPGPKPTRGRCTPPPVRVARPEPPPFQTALGVVAKL